MRYTTKEHGLYCTECLIKTPVFYTVVKSQSTEVVDFGVCIECAITAANNNQPSVIRVSPTEEGSDAE